MTGWRWERISIAKMRPARGRVRITAMAIGALLALGVAVEAGWAAESDAASSAQPSATTVSAMGISAEADVLRLTFESRGPVRYRLSSGSDALSPVLRLENASFEGLGSRVAVGDGLLDAVEFATEGHAGVITLRLSRAARTEFAAREGGFDLVLAPLDRQAQASPAPAEPGMDVAATEGRIDFKLGKAPGEVKAVLLSDGLHLVVDASGVDAAPAEYLREFDGDLAKVAARKSGDLLRAVIEVRSRAALADYTVEKGDAGFSVILPKMLAAMARKDGSASLAPAAQAETKAAGGGAVVDFGFHQDEARSYIDLAVSKTAETKVVEATGTRVVIDVKNTMLPKKFQRALDTSAFNGPVRLVAAYGRGADTRVVIDLKDAAPFQVEPRESGFAVAFEGGSRPSGKAAEPAPEPKEKIVLVKEGEAASGTAMTSDKGGSSSVIIEGIPASAPVAGAEGQYSGQRISMDFVDADIRNVLRLIGDVAGLNMVAGSEVTGKITLRLIDVPWDQALDVILKAKGLDKVSEGNVMRIVAADKIAAERAQKAAALAAAAKLKEEETPLESDILPVSYAKASEVLDKIKALLSKRGSATVDERTNTILVRDMPDQIQSARAMVAKLDSPTPQVLIEARIVEVSSRYTEDLGIQWGGKFTADAAHGNATGYGFPNSIGLKGDTGLSNYAVNLPATAASAGGPGAALALSLGSINDIIGLDLRLSALETSGKGRVVSSPRVTTLDNRPAKILQGIEIPFTTATEEKIETQSIDYLLELNVTPHVTSDGSVIMKIDLKKDAPSTTYFAVDSKTPAKETRQAVTEVLVKDGETTVIGGIITDTTSELKSGIPWFHKIPLIGWMFQNKSTSNDKTELIIFITPKIVKNTIGVVSQ